MQFALIFLTLLLLPPIFLIAVVWLSFEPSGWVYLVSAGVGLIIGMIINWTILLRDM